MVETIFLKNAIYLSGKPQEITAQLAALAKEHATVQELIVQRLN